LRPGGRRNYFPQRRKAAKIYENFYDPDLRPEEFRANVKKAVFIFILTGAFSVGAFAQSGSGETIEPPPASSGLMSDGCTWFPDGNYRDCCTAHDEEYFAGGSWKARWRSDKKLFQCVAAKPKFYNKMVAPFIWLGVRTGGAPWLNTRFSWGFGKRKKSSDRILKKKKTKS
jgi:hypothetical protein